MKYRGYRGIEALDPMVRAGDGPTAPTAPSLDGLGAAEQAAASRREIANLLTGRAMGRQATSLGTGLAQLGEAWLANRAMRKADTADAKVAEVRDALLGRAMNGDMEALAHLDLGAALTQRNRGEDIARADRIRGEDIQRETDWRGQDIDLQRERWGAEDQRFADQMQQRQNQFDAGLAFDRQRHADEMGLRRHDQALGAAKLEGELAEQMQENAGLNPSLRGLPPGVQSAIVGDDLDAIDAADAEAKRTRQIRDIALQFMGGVGEQKEDGSWRQTWGGLGGGFVADIAQMSSQKTADLKGYTERLIKLLRTPGEGPMTDADARRAEKSVVSINKGISANANFLATSDALEANAAAYEDWLRRAQAEGGYGSGNEAKRVWTAYSEANPIFDDDGKPIQTRPSIDDWFAARARAAELAEEKQRLLAEEKAERTRQYDMRDIP